MLNFRIKIPGLSRAVETKFIWDPAHKSNIKLFVEDNSAK